MNNKLIPEDISKKNQIKLYRNASLDSTSSTLRVKKIILCNEYTPLIKMTQSKKNILDFPICMSLFTNNQSLSEKDSKIKLNSSYKFNLNCPGLNNNSLKINKKNELLLPKTKKIISRNIDGKVLNSFTPIIKSSILNISKFPTQSSRNILLKKINYSPLYRLSSNVSKDIKILKKYKYNLKNYSNSNSTLEQEISAIRSVKNTSSGNINYINQNEKKQYPIPFLLISPRDNGAKIKKTAKFSNEIINEIKKNEELFKEKKLKSSSNNYNLKEVFKRNNKLEDITENETIMKRRTLFKKKNELNESKISKKNKNKNKNKKIIFKSDKEEKKKEDNEQNDVNKAFSRSPSKQKTLSVQSIEEKEKKEKEDKKSKENEKYPVNLMIDKEKLEKLKNNKFYLAVYNKTTIDVYRKNSFLNDLNKKITEKTINNRINTKIFLRKTEMLINKKELMMKKIIEKGEKKLKKHEDFKKEEIFIYFQEKLKNRKKMKKYKDTYIEMHNIKINLEYNCNLDKTLMNYLFITIEFEQLSLNMTIKKIPKKKISALNTVKVLKPVNDIKRQNSLPTKNNINDDDSDVGFTKKKSTVNYNKKYLKWITIPHNLIFIHNYILKSLPIDDQEIWKNRPKKKRKTGNMSVINYQLFHRNTSKRLGALNNPKTVFKKLNTFNSIQNENEITKELIKRGSNLTFEDLKNTLKRQISQKSSDSNPEYLFSVLKHSNFFKKDRTNEDFRDPIKDNKKKKLKIQRKDSLINLEDLYFELIKLIIEGNNNAFQKYFIKYKTYIDINQELFDGNTLLILSAREGNYYITKFLCEQNADVNIQNCNGNTALHFAIGKQFYAIADILTRHGATEDIKNIRGLSPWDCIENNIE